MKLRNSRAAVFVALQLLLVACAVIMAIWTEMPWLTSIALAVIGLSAVTRRLLLYKGNPFWRCWPAAAWAATLTVPAGILLARGKPFTVDDYQVVMSWMMVGAILLAYDFRAASCGDIAWKLLIAAWLFPGCFICLSQGYLHNLPGHFYFGLLLSVALLIASKFCFRMPTPAVIAGNTVILLMVGLPIADLLMRPNYHLTTHPDANKKYYSYDIAKMDPATFARWWDYYRSQYDLLAGRVYTHEPGDVVPYRFIPNSQSPFFESLVSINSKGFRGREIPDQKADTYRIVALGESTTFGLTLGAKDRPWPDVLEELIRERLKPQRPVHVINAGVPGYTILDNLHRLPKDILPLKPDMIISYHGYNGFHLIDASLPRVHGTVPAYRTRPLRLLALCEYRLKMIIYKRSQASVSSPRAPSVASPLQTEYAEAYRQIIHCVQTNGIRLALANYSMAVNSQSDSDLIEFYRVAFPSLISRIQANAHHSFIVKELAAQNDGVLFVDTHPNLDGHHEKFVDVVHFTQDGDQQIAENIFAGIRKTLEQDLASPQSSDSNSRNMPPPASVR